MSAWNSIGSVVVDPCDECGHSWWDHTWKNRCLRVIGHDERGRVWCPCEVTKGRHTSFGLVLSKGRYVRGRTP